MDSALTFTAETREQIRAELIAAAKSDACIVGAAHLGSAALGRLDRWSDIDLGLCLAPDVPFQPVLLDWTTRLYRDYRAVAHYDVRRGTTLYRVFLLDNTLQVDLSFWPVGEFRAIGEKFSVVFGSAGKPLPARVPDSSELIGLAWLYALHVRSSIARGRLLQAEHMLSGMRDNVLALTCKRHQVATSEGRGFDDLPEVIRRRAADCLAVSIELAELVRAFRATTAYLLDELSYETGSGATLARTLQMIASFVAADSDSSVNRKNKF